MAVLALALLVGLARPCVAAPAQPAAASATQHHHAPPPSDDGAAPVAGPCAAGCSVPAADLAGPPPPARVALLRWRIEAPAPPGRTGPPADPPPR